jgi:hypothetical protein
MKTASGHRLDIQIRQGANPDDFMLVGRLVSNSSQEANKPPSCNPSCTAARTN